MAFEPMKTGRMRDAAMLRSGRFNDQPALGDAPHGVDERHHRVLVSHGYKVSGKSPGGSTIYSHPSGMEARHLSGITVSGKEKQGYGLTDHSDLNTRLEKLHGPAKHSDEAVGAMFGTSRDFDHMLRKHGYQYNHTVDGPTGRITHYDHPETGHIASVHHGEKGHASDGHVEHYKEDAYNKHVVHNDTVGLSSALKKIHGSHE